MNAVKPEPTKWLLEGQCHDDWHQKAMYEKSSHCPTCGERNPEWQYEVSVGGK